MSTEDSCNGKMEHARIYVLHKDHMSPRDYTTGNVKQVPLDIKRKESTQTGKHKVKSLTMGYSQRYSGADLGSKLGVSTQEQAPLIGKGPPRFQWSNNSAEI